MQCFLRHTPDDKVKIQFSYHKILVQCKKMSIYFLCGLVTSGTSFFMGRFHPTNSVKTYRKQLLGTTAWARSIWQMAAKTAVDSYRCVYTRNRQDLIEVFKMCNGLSWLKLNELFTLDDNNRGTRGHSCKLAKFRCTRDCCIFSNRVINRWNQLEQRAVGASSINAFKGWLSKKRKQGWASSSSWTSPPSPRPPQWVFWLVRPHKVSNTRWVTRHSFTHNNKVMK